MRRALLIALASLCQLGCDRVYYPPPPQKTPQKHTVEMLLDMTAGRPAEAWGSIVSGIHKGGAPGADWRWTGDRAVFRFIPGVASGWSVAAHLTAAQPVLDKTGPQQVSFEVNGEPVGSATLDVSRRYDLTFPVGPDLMGSGTVELRMMVTPCVPAQYSPPYCVLLHSIGFERDSR